MSRMVGECSILVVKKPSKGNITQGSRKETAKKDKE